MEWLGPYLPALMFASLANQNTTYSVQQIISTNCTNCHSGTNSTSGCGSGTCSAAGRSAGGARSATGGEQAGEQHR